LELPVILLVEDDPLLQNLVEEALSDGGFEAAIAASGEEAVTLLRGQKGKYRALVIDINLKGRMDGWEVAQHAREIEPDFPGRLHERGRCGGMDIQRRPKEHHAGKAIRSRTTRHRSCQSSQ
jgi:CheY-like chemotaxis protein